MLQCTLFTGNLPEGGSDVLQGRLRAGPGVLPPRTQAETRASGVPAGNTEGSGGDRKLRGK